MFASCVPPTGDLANNSDMCPDRELNRPPFGSQAGTHSVELHQPGPFAHYLIALFVFLVWSHVNSLYVLEIKPLSKVSLANTFSHMFHSLFILLMFSLAVQKFFNWWSPISLFFPLCPLFYGPYQWKCCCVEEYLRFSCLCSPLGLLWCHDLYLSLLFILSLFLCIVQVSCWISFFFACSCPDLPTSFVEEAVFTPFYAPATFVKY